jgi:GT2 family glycosyltransferase
VDNASTDGSAELVRARAPAVRLIAGTENQGFARANNTGIRATTGENVLLLNSDTLVPAGALDRLLAALDAEPAAAAAGPRLVDGDGWIELSWGPAISPIGELWQKTLLASYRAGLPAAARHVQRAARTRRFVDWVSGACLLVRRADAVAVGLLDERYFMYGEDVDFCTALRARGRRVLFTPDAEIVHLRGRSVAAAPEATRRAMVESKAAFYRKHHPRWAGVYEWYARRTRS